MEQTPNAPTCYRHPGRTTYLSCSDCGKPICVDCSIDTPVGQKCPDCAKQRGTAKIITGSQLRARTTSLPPVTMFLMASSVIVYVLGAFSPELNRVIFDNFALWPADVQNGSWWLLATTAFLHSGVMHILFNMWALYVLGPGIERQVGSAPFAGLYLASALMGSVAYVAFNSGPAVGASGAVFGLFGAWLASAWKTRNSVAGRAQLQSIGVILGINLLLPLAVPRIAWEAHVGGLIAGFVIAFAWTQFARDERTRSVIAFGVAAVALVLGILL
jgi:membrane associated rhomboid family serine protease